MAWKIKFLPEAEKDLKQIDRPVVRRILGFLYDRIRPLDDPRKIGEALKGPELGKYWKYRVGDYRIICQIRKREISILVVRVGLRKDIYR
ncbi:type II toxin-antitoxin system RelE/ParE family toxin [bacterium]|nr:type II toxin-antitoxin system RelE/ParE family toxin [bacterium]